MALTHNNSYDSSIVHFLCFVLVMFLFQNLLTLAITLESVQFMRIALCGNFIALDKKNLTQVFSLKRLTGHVKGCKTSLCVSIDKGNW